MLKFIIQLLFIFIIFSCASAPKSYPPLEQAKSLLAATKQEQNIEEVASVSLFQADEYIQNAEQALQDNDIGNTDHYIYLAKRKQEVAKELLIKHQYEQEIVRLKQQQQEMVAHARSIESKRAHTETQTAQQRVKQLEQTLWQYQAEETSRGTLLVINDLLFATGGASLLLESAKRLEPLLQYMKGNPQREIIIEGHTDSIGDAGKNKLLSQQRANAVKQFLTSRNIDYGRIETRGFGEEVPVATNTTNAGRRLNRRVEIVIKTATEYDN